MFWSCLVFFWQSFPKSSVFQNCVEIRAIVEDTGATRREIRDIEDEVSIAFLFLLHFLQLLARIIFRSHFFYVSDRARKTKAVCNQSGKHCA